MATRAGGYHLGYLKVIKLRSVQGLFGLNRYPDLLFRFRIVVPVFCTQNLEMRSVVEEVAGSRQPGAEDVFEDSIICT